MSRWVSLLVCLLPVAASASPWVLPRGAVVVEGRYDYSMADEEFLDEGGARPFSLNGEYASSTYTLGARFGFTDRLEFEISLPIRQVNYNADPVVLVPGDGPVEELFDYYQENVIDLSRSESGLGDLTLAARYQLVNGAFAVATEFRLKTPTGYDPPAGTFGDRPRTRQEFIADVGTLVDPDNVEDDVTLGDGQVDLSGSVLLGWGLRTGTFFRLDAGFKKRFGGAGDQAIGALRVGQLFWNKLMLVTGGEVEYTVTRGEVIGISVVADDPTLPAEDYGGLTNLLLREVRLERDAITLPVGAIIRASDNVEFSASYSRVLWGRNTAATQSLSIGVGVRTNVL